MEYRGPVYSLPYQVSAGMENLTLDRAARCFCTCRDDEKQVNGAYTPPKCCMCLPSHTGINLTEADGDWP